MLVIKSCGIDAGLEAESQASQAQHGGDAGRMTMRSMTCTCSVATGLDVFGHDDTCHGTTELKAGSLTARPSKTAFDTLDS